MEIHKDYKVTSQEAKDIIDEIVKNENFQHLVDNGSIEIVFGENSKKNQKPGPCAFCLIKIVNEGMEHYQCDFCIYFVELDKDIHGLAHISELSG